MLNAGVKKIPYNKINIDNINRKEAYNDSNNYLLSRNSEPNSSFLKLKEVNSRINNNKNDSFRNSLKKEINIDKKKFHEDEIVFSDKPIIDYRKLTKREKICDSDTEDEGSDANKYNMFLILPDDTFKKIWDSLMALIILYSSIVLPYKIAFEEEDNNFDIVSDIIFNILFFFDIIFCFFSAYIDEDDNLIKSWKKIIHKYLTTWFIIDFISVVPINYFTDNNQARINTLARLTRIPKLYRLIRLTKLFRMLKILKKGNVGKFTRFFLEKFKVNANVERLIFFILGFLLLNHLAACIWFFVAKMEDFSPDSWVTRLGYIDTDNDEVYIVAFYWTLTTVTTVGYGDINAGTTAERIYNLFIMSCGVLMYSFAIGSLSSIVSSLDAKTAEMNQKLQILSSIKKEFNLDQEIYDKVRKVIKYDLSRNQKDKMNFLQELPNKLRIELSQIMHDSVIQKMHFFKNQPNDFIAYVAPLLKPVKFSQNDYLYKVEDTIDEMYFISKGTVSLCLPKEYGEKEIREVKKHHNFGEIEMCLSEKLKYSIKIKSRNCELFVLKKNDFLKLSVNYKEFIEKFLYKSLMIFLRFVNEKKRIMRLTEAANGNIKKIEEEGEEDVESLEMIDEVNEVNSESSSKESSNSSSRKTKENPDNDSLEDQSNEKITKLNHKFTKKVEKIIDFLEKYKSEFDGLSTQTIQLIKKLKITDDLHERNELIDIIEDSLADILK